MEGWDHQTTRRAPLARKEVSLFIALLLALIAIRLLVVGGGDLGNDSYQYLSIADPQVNPAPKAANNSVCPR